MRVVVVSAHYPPNFVSGGTLQPQRLAVALRDQGHDVSVFAGWLGDRRALEEWEEVDGTGLPVHWVAVSPFTEWSDRRNFRNHGVAHAFARYLTRQAPDVVHVHAVQALGAGVVEVATKARVRTVVTMHDFWWCCGRQFLADRQLHPCSPVVDAGVCPCEVNHRWLERRNQYLKRALRGVDVILAPSESAARVIRANGLCPSIVEVNENGLPAPPDPAAPPAPGTTAGPSTDSTVVRFLYASGADPLKGVGVLARACHLLRDVDRWTLTAYSWIPEPPPKGVTVLPPFDPTDTAAVLGVHDVLVLPSVARESHSQLTREALAAGLPVVCSDSLGPEEVVVDGRNGFVVPTGDAAALAAVLRRFTAEPELLPTLRAATGDVTMRGLGAQVVELEAVYHRLTGPALAPRRPGRLPSGHDPRRVLFIVGIQGAPLRYRVHLPAEGLRLLGVDSEVRWYTDPGLAGAAARADAVVVYRSPATPWLLDVIGQARSSGKHVLFDVDDLIFDPDLATEVPALVLLDERERAQWLEGVHRYRTTMEACDTFVASTDPLARHAAAVTGLPVARFDNGVGLRLGRLSDRAARSARPPGPLRVGYFSGTVTRDLDWAEVESAVVDAVRAVPGAELWLVGLVRPGDAASSLGTRLRQLPFQAWEGLPTLLRTVDVNLAPLVTGHAFNECKSAVKWLEAALVGTPTVASPTEPYRNAVDHGSTGLLATSGGEWVEAVGRLLRDDILRARVGAAARREALLRWSPHLQGRRYAALLRDRPLTPRPAATWPPVVVEEPMSAQPIDRYEPENAIGRARRVLAGPGRLVRRSRRSG